MSGVGGGGGAKTLARGDQRIRAKSFRAAQSIVAWGRRGEKKCQGLGGNKIMTLSCTSLGRTLVQRGCSQSKTAVRQLTSSASMFLADCPALGYHGRRSQGPLLWGGGGGGTGITVSVFLSVHVHGLCPENVFVTAEPFVTRLMYS